MGLRIIGEGRGRFDGGHEDEMERELKRAYRKGREDERRESREGYGERGGYGRGGYGERDEYDHDEYDRDEYDRDEYDDYGYGERRGVKGTGRYSRYRRR